MIYIFSLRFSGRKFLINLRILLNKNINFNKNETESKLRNPTNSFREKNLVLQLMQKSQIKSKTVMNWSSRKKKRGHSLYSLYSHFVLSNFFLTFLFYLFTFLLVFFLILWEPSVYPEVNGGKFVTVQSVEEMKIQINKFDY